jgi:putative intracellular protease/amidase
MKIVMVLTCPDKLSDPGKQSGLWLEEFAAPYYLFKDAGAEIILASPKGEKLPLNPKSDGPNSQASAMPRFKNDKEAQQSLANTVKLSSIRAEDHDAVFYPGSHGPL